jgi:hypothetical protein
MGNKFEVYSSLDIKQYGPSKGIILGLIRKWCKINQKAKRYYYDGAYWTGHITQEEMSNQTGLDIQTTKRSLKWLIDNEIIAKGNYNKHKYDKTGWYYPLVQIDTIVVLKSTNAKYQNDTMDSIEMIQTIPINPLLNTINPPINPTNNPLEELYNKLKSIENILEEDIFTNKEQRGDAYIAKEKLLKEIKQYERTTNKN